MTKCDMRLMGCLPQRERCYMVIYFVELLHEESLPNCNTAMTVFVQIK